MTEPTYITCRELIDFIADYREGALPPTTAHEVDRHLAVCPSCAEYLAGYETTIAATKLASASTVATESMPPALVAAILAARQR